MFTVEHIKRQHNFLFALIVSNKSKRGTADVVQHAIHNVLAILDLRLQRWLDVVVPLPLAFANRMSIDYDSEGRLCAFCVTPGAQTTTLDTWRNLNLYNEQIDGPITLVTWRGPIG